MRKIILSLFIFAFCYSNTNALTLNGIYSKIDSIYSNSPSKIELIYQKIYNTKNKFKVDSVNYFTLWEIENYISDKVNNGTGKVITENRLWEINEVKIFENQLKLDSKKLIGINISYKNLLNKSYIFPGDYTVGIFAKDKSGIEYIPQSMEEILPYLKGGEIKSGENNNGWIFFILDTNIEKIDINFSFKKYGIDKIISREIIVPVSEVIKKKQEEKIKQEEENKIKRLSSDKRPIGMVEITAKNYSALSDSNKVYEIITTNNIVKGYELYKNLKTGEIDKYSLDNLETGYFDEKTGEIYVAYHRFRYEYIMKDVMTFSNSFTIKGTDVYYKDTKIGIFYPNQLYKFTINDIPLTQGCTDIWTDNTVDKIYYTKDSKFFNDIFNERAYNYDNDFFCSEKDAVNAGYKKSAN